MFIGNTFGKFETGRVIGSQVLTPILSIESREICEIGNVHEESNVSIPRHIAQDSRVRVELEGKCLRHSIAPSDTA